jgi:hypothetical protein
MSKTALGALSVAISFVAYSIYLWQTIKSEDIQPHPLSWFLWGFVTGVATVAQWAKGAGPGYWVTAFTAIICFIISGITFSQREWRFSRSEYVSLAVGLAAIVWYGFAKNATACAVLATIADVLGYNSTIRKGWEYPHSDSVTSFMLNAAKFIPAIFALNAYSIATWLYPATLVLMNAGVAIMLAVRRDHLKKKSPR